MSFFLGIDAGGTKTDCVLADASGVILSHGSGGGANLGRTPLATLEASLAAALAGALHHVGLRTARFEAVCAGFAGAGQPEPREVARRILSALASPRHLFIVGDMEVALEAAVGPGPGVVVIAGTGSIAYGRNALGQQARAGGRGPVVSDEGSAGDIGRRALEAVLRAQDGEERVQALEAAVRAQLKLSDRRGLSGILAHPDSSQHLAALLPTVVEVARSGDQLSNDILLVAGDVLAQLALHVLRTLRLEATPARVATCGGVFAASREVSEQVHRRLRAWAPQAQVASLATPPAEGAVRLAQRLWLQQRAALPKGSP